MIKIFLTGHLYVSGTWQDLECRVHTTDASYDEVGYNIMLMLENACRRHSGFGTLSNRVIYVIVKEEELEKDNHFDFRP